MNRLDLHNQQDTEERRGWNFWGEAIKIIMASALFSPGSQAQGKANSHAVRMHKQIYPQPTSTKLASMWISRLEMDLPPSSVKTVKPTSQSCQNTLTTRFTSIHPTLFSHFLGPHPRRDGVLDSSYTSAPTGWKVSPLLSCAQHFVTPWTAARQAPLSLGLPRQEYLHGLPFLFPEDLAHPGI